MPEMPMSVEERLERLERMMSKLRRNGGDYLMDEGYLQIGDSNRRGAVRLDGDAVQVAMGDDGNASVGMYFVPTLDPQPLLNGPHAILSAQHTAVSQAIAAALTARQSPTQVGSGANGFVQVGANTLNAFAQLVADFEDDGFAAYLKVIDDGSDPRIVWSIDGGLEEFRLGEGGMELIVKAADETVSGSTTLQDDNDFVIAVAPNERVQFEMLLLAEGNTGGVDVTFSVPSGAVGRFARQDLGDSGDEITNEISLNITSGSGVQRFFRGGVVNGVNAGNIRMRWAQTVASGSSTIHAGSYLKWQKQ